MFVCRNLQRGQTRALLWHKQRHIRIQFGTSAAAATTTSVHQQESKLFDVVFTGCTSEYDQPECEETYVSLHPALEHAIHRNWPLVVETVHEVDLNAQHVLKLGVFSNETQHLVDEFLENRSVDELQEVLQSQLKTLQTLQTLESGGPCFYQVQEREDEL